MLRTGHPPASPPDPPVFGPAVAELDRIDDELFSTDYLVPSQRRHDSVLPELPTLRLAPWAPPADQTVRLRPGPSAVPVAPRYVATQAMWWWLTPHRPTTARARRYQSEPDGPEAYGVLIGLAVLAVVAAVAGAAVVLWWLT